jgi:hypothetical protein
VLKAYFPDPPMPAPPKSFGSSRSGRSTLAVERSGAYRYSIVPSLDDFTRLDTSVFRFPPELQHLLSSLYETGFSFLACIIDASAELVPIAYEHTKLVGGKFFLPTVHFHGQPSATATGAPHKSDLGDWDHEIYSIGASDMHAGDRSMQVPGETIGWKEFTSRVPFPMPAWIPTRQLRMIRVQGDHPNRDIIWEAESTITSALDVCSAVHTGRKHVEQPWFMCITCSTSTSGEPPRFNPSEGCCVACATKCHAGHSLAFAGCTPFFCDCGVSGAGCRALQAPKPGSSEAVATYPPFGVVG